MGAVRLLLVPLSLVAGAVGLVAVQGVSARRTIERLPEADGLEDTRGPFSGAPLHLVVLGDSVAAGVGIAHHDATLAGRLAVLLSDGHAVRRAVVAQSGLTAGGVLDLVDSRAPELASADVVVLSVGVNDAKGLHSTRRWRAELTALLDALSRTAPRAQVVLLGVPDMSMFTRLPRPLRSVMGLRSRALDRAGRSIVSSYPSVQHLPLNGPAFDVERPFASDGFHPSEAVHAAFADEIHRLL
ncbi:MULTISPECIES: SGNH/GDSL hydrolase family protein [unclassified Nocardioides]|uniref:SGNH/GDSL hydrolase family protein n=1 Tax=unclassified Nocardioides TaxID=2615069 RepID=UPI0009E6A608|nr:MULTISPECIES: SGNH/GDSL hydrolase family protein [unclassified Nocardioides]